MFERRIKIAFGVAAVLAVLLASSLMIVRADGGSDSSQTYASARYALLSGPVLVNGSNFEAVTQDAVLKIDTVTGNVWVLQMSIQSKSQPTITAATFIPTTNASGIYQPQTFLPAAGVGENDRPGEGN